LEYHSIAVQAPKSTVHPAPKLLEFKHLILALADGSLGWLKIGNLERQDAAIKLASYLMKESSF
jgi:hypothetical protein